MNYQKFQKKSKKKNQTTKTDLKENRLNEKAQLSFESIPGTFTKEDIKKLFNKLKNENFQINPDRVIETRVGSGPLKI